MEKKSFLIVIPLFVMIVFLAGFAFMGQYNSNNDVAPTSSNISALDTATPSGFPYPEMFNFNFSNIGGMNEATVGAMYVNGKYYFNRWSGNVIMYRYWANGPGGGPGTRADSVSVPAVIRDLTWNGKYLYGSPASTTLYKFDTLGVSKGTFNLAGHGNIRNIAWDPNRGAFWYSDWGNSSPYNIYCKDTANNLKGTLTLNWPSNKYGLAWDSTGGSAYLWVWNQNQSTAIPTINGLYKFRIQPFAKVDSFFFSYSGEVQEAIAGGAEVCRIGNNMVLLLNSQNFALQGYILRTVTAIGDPVLNVPAKYNLSQNYPNPFNPSTKISFTVIKPGYAYLKVYDLSGKEVATLVDGNINAGIHTVSFDGSKLASGVYMYKLFTMEYTSVKKMMLIK
jgi:hypothetical protein